MDSKEKINAYLDTMNLCKKLHMSKDNLQDSGFVVLGGAYINKQCRAATCIAGDMGLIMDILVSRFIDNEEMLGIVATAIKIAQHEKNKNKNENKI